MANGSELLTPKGTTAANKINKIIKPAAVIKPKPAAPKAPAAQTPAPQTQTPQTTPPPSGPTENAVATSVSAVLSSILTPFGLGDLASFGQDQIATLFSQGVTDPTSISDELYTQLQTTPQWQAAFPANVTRAANGLPQLSPTDYIATEDSMNSALAQAGIPTSLVPNAVTNAIAGDVSASEFSQRLNLGVSEVNNAPPEIAQAFSDIFGVADSPAALAAYYLGTGSDVLEGQIATAQASGLGAMHGVAITNNRAAQIGALGETMDTMAQHYANLDKISGIFTQSVGEGAQASNSAANAANGGAAATAPLTEADQGTAAEFGLDAGATRQVAQAEAGREEEFNGGGGASSTSAEGFAGIGAAHSS